MYVIYCSEKDSYVAKSPSEYSYTKKLQNAKIYKSISEVNRDICGNETMLTLEQAMGVA